MACVGAAFGPERSLTVTELQTTAFQHRRQHGILQQIQILLMQLEGHMSVAQVISRLHQRQG